MSNPFGEVEDWKPVEDAFDAMVKEAFPDAGPLAKYESGITFHKDGSVVVSWRGKEVTINPASNRRA